MQSDQIRKFQGAALSCARWCTPLFAALAGALMERGYVLEGLFAFGAVFGLHGSTLVVLDVLLQFYCVEYKCLTGKEP